MPQYFCNFIDDDVKHYDDEGVCLSNSAQAREQVIRTLLDIARDTLPGQKSGSEITVVVTDESRRLVFSSQLRFVVRDTESSEFVLTCSAEDGDAER